MSAESGIFSQISVNLSRGRTLFSSSSSLRQPVQGRFLLSAPFPERGAMRGKRAVAALAKKNNLLI